MNPAFNHTNPALYSNLKNSSHKTEITVKAQYYTTFKACVKKSIM